MDYKIKNKFPKLIKKYSRDDFIIVSYSLDTNEKAWEKPNKDNKINRLSISELKGMKDKNITKLAVTAILNSFLIDQNGIVIKSFVKFFIRSKYN